MPAWQSTARGQPHRAGAVPYVSPPSSVSSFPGEDHLMLIPWLYFDTNQRLGVKLLALLHVRSKAFFRPLESKPHGKYPTTGAKMPLPS